MERRLSVCSCVSQCFDQLLPGSLANPRQLSPEASDRHEGGAECCCQVDQLIKAQARFLSHLRVGVEQGESHGKRDGAAGSRSYAQPVFIQHALELEYIDLPGLAGHQLNAICAPLGSFCQFFFQRSAEQGHWYHARNFRCLNG